MRERYPELYAAPPLPDEPTSAAPGSEEKIQVMRARHEAGRHIHHPDDAKDYRFRARSGRIQEETTLTPDEEGFVRMKRMLGMSAEAISREFGLNYRAVYKMVGELDEEE